VAVDLQVVFPQEVIRLNRIQYTSPGPLNLPRALDIIGEDFRSVDEVLINDIPSPDVLILGQRRLIAQLPDVLQKTGDVSGVTVLSRRLTVTQRSLIRFRLSDQPGRVTGILRLVQLFLKVLFTTPGKDIFSKRTGGGALKNIGSTFGKSEGGNILSDFVIATATTARQIVSIQSRDPKIPRDERLLAAKVVRGGFNRELGALLVSVELTSQAGRAATANLEL
jgi:hypothetical protein